MPLIPRIPSLRTFGGIPNAQRSPWRVLLAQVAAELPPCRRPTPLQPWLRRSLVSSKPCEYSIDSGCARSDRPVYAGCWPTSVALPLRVSANAVQGLASSMLILWEALLFYDYVLTFSREIRCIWHRKFTGATVLFLLNRYIFLVYRILMTVETFSLGGNAQAGQMVSGSYEYASHTYIVRLDVLLCFLCEVLIVHMSMQMRRGASYYSSANDRDNIGDSTCVLCTTDEPAIHRTTSLHLPAYVCDMVQKPQDIRFSVSSGHCTHRRQHGASPSRCLPYIGMTRVRPLIGSSTTPKYPSLQHPLLS